MELCAEFLELARQLNQEKLFVASEKRHLQSLHEQLQRTVQRLFHVAWIARQQRVNLDNLVLSRQECTPSACCQRASALEAVRFVDAYRRLGFRESHYGQFVQSLRVSPALLATCLAAGERMGLVADMQRLVHVVLDSVYGHGMLREDEQLILQVLQCLLETQLACAPDPRRLLRHGTCAFGRVYKVFAEGLHSAKLFLTGALHEPILQLLMEDELFLDIDPGKAAVRFPPRERLRRFGAEGSAQHAASLQRYRAWTVRKLVQLTERFVLGIRRNLYCFPASLLGLVRQLYRVLRSGRHVESREAGAMCADLVFAFFVCPAIVNPEPYGICDAPIGYVARFNLMQVAHILQVLAMAKWEAPDPKLADLYGQFDSDCMSAVLDYIMLDGGDEEADTKQQPSQPQSSSSSLPAVTGGTVDERAVRELVRTAILVTDGDLQALIRFLRRVHEGADDSWVDKKALGRVLANLPSPPANTSTSNTTANGTPSGGNRGDSVGRVSTPPHSSPGGVVPPTPPATPAAKKSLLGGKNKSRAAAAANHQSPQTGGAGDTFEQQMPHGQRSSGGEVATATEETGGGLPAANNATVQMQEIEDVLVISLNVSAECPGMLAEHQVLSLEHHQQQHQAAVAAEAKQQQRRSALVSASATAGGVGGEGVCEGAALMTMQQQQQQQQQEKRTRFSLSHEQEDSIGNTSDNLEAVSEAASNHSVSSSIELENENDNLSDMISANVSGRGTPNVSGRDTPSSQVEGEEGRERDRRTLDLPVTAQKQNREDISDKFGKFEIRTLLEGDETISLVSDTWSTDVLASDSETVEQSERPLLEDVGHALRSGGARLPDAGGSCAGPPAVSETASEAWSTDNNLASDSERLQDVDTDDTASLTRSDDATARSDDATIAQRLDVTTDGDGATPRANHSPVDGLLGSGAGGGARGWLSTLHAAAGFRPIADPSAAVSGSATTNSLQQAFAMPLIAAPKVLRHPVSVMVHDFNDLETRIKDCRPKGPRQSDSFKYSQGKVASILSTFDPLSETAAGAENDDLTDAATTNTTANAISELEAEMEGQLDGDDVSAAPPPPSDDTPTADFLATQSLGRLSLIMDGLQLPPLPLSGGGGDTAATDVIIARHQPSDGDMVAALLDSDDVNDASSLSPPSPGLLTFPVANSSPLTANGTPPGFFYPLPPSNGEAGSAGGGVSGGGGGRSARASGDAGSSSSSSNGSGAGGASGGQQVTSATQLLNGGKQHRHPQQRRRQQQQELQQTMTSVAPTASSGAIPKSISFDKTAEKGDKDCSESDDKGKKSFFKSFKLSLKRPSRKGPRYHEEHRANEESNHKDEFASDGVRKLESEEKNGETGDDILAKYRTKTAFEPLLSDAGAELRRPDYPAGTVPPDKSSGDGRAAVGSAPPTEVGDNEVEGPDGSYVFQDAKRKLRLVLSTVDARAAPWLEHAVGARGTSVANTSDVGGGGGGGHTFDNELVAFLRVQLAEAVNLQDRSLTAQLHETLRCVQGFDQTGCKRLLESLKEDYKSRYPYVAYLIRCRQGLLFALSHLERLLKRVERDQAVCNRFMISVCVRFFLEQQERAIQKFMEEFQKLTASDEKTVIVEQFLQFLDKQMEQDAIWSGASSSQLEQAHGVIERSIMSQIYILALYPNGDGDVHRDQVLHEHILKLSKVVTPNHKDLRIPKMYHYECPWPSAQAEIITINAYKTPRDKLECVVRCCTTIMNLLSMSNERAVPAADDFVPVLVYVLLKANPPCLLSTVQFVNSFYQKQLHGEDEYWWTQFCAALEFIKTM